MINLNQHIYRCGPNESDDLSEEDLRDTEKLRKQIEPWLTAVFQSEHLSLLLGTGFTCGIALAAGGKSADMSKCKWGCDLKKKVDEYAHQMRKDLWTRLSEHRGSDAHGDATVRWTHGHVR